MKKGWYILNYHDINWEENVFMKGIGGTYPPDIFYKQMKLYADNARLMSVEDAYKLYKNNQITEPIFSIWFDDGLAGNRKYALPILEEFNTKAAISLNSDFFLHQDIFYGNKLSYILFNDGMRFLRTKLKTNGYYLNVNTSIKDFSKSNFDLKLNKIIDDLYNEMTNENIRKEAFKLYDNVENIKTLIDHKWTITNHTKSHFPITNANCIHLFEAQFNLCEMEIEKAFNVNTEFWVLPFDRPDKSDNLEFIFNTINNNNNRNLVFVEDKINLNNFKSNLLFRISVPYLEEKKLLDYIKNRKFA
ncbi:NodB homology domain containing protein [Flavobacteriaceae bacterium]